MTTKKLIPWQMLYLLLFIMLIASYFISGLFAFPDVTLINYGEYLTYILFHPFHLWWNDKTPVVMGTACILWLMGVSYFLTYYRNYHFGAEHGTADAQELIDGINRSDGHTLNMELLEEIVRTDDEKQRYSFNEDHFRTSVKVCLSPTFYGWVFQWEGRIRIEGPEKAVTAYKEMVKKALFPDHKKHSCHLPK